MECLAGPGYAGRGGLRGLRGASITAGPQLPVTHNMVSGSGRNSVVHPQRRSGMDKAERTRQLDDAALLANLSWGHIAADLREVCTSTGVTSASGSI